MVEETFFKIYKQQIFLKHSNPEHSGLMDIYGYMQATQEQKTYSPEDKLNWIFAIFDQNGIEPIHFKEMGDILISLFTLFGIKVQEFKLITQLQEMLKNLDKDDARISTRGNFIRNAVSCLFITHLVNGKLFSRICSVPEFSAEDLTILARKTKLTNKEIILKNEDFNATHQSGVITKEQFLSHFKLNDSKHKSIATAMFDVLNINYNGTLNFLEFMLAANAGKMISADEKLDWIFNVFDEKGTDVLMEIEVSEVVAGLFRMAGIRIDKSIITSLVDELLESVNCETEKVITKEKFLMNAMKCDFVSDIINDDVINGLIQL